MTWTFSSNVAGPRRGPRRSWASSEPFVTHPRRAARRPTTPRTGASSPAATSARRSRATLAVTAVVVVGRASRCSSAPSTAPPGGPPSSAVAFLVLVADRAGVRPQARSATVPASSRRSSAPASARPPSWRSAASRSASLLPADPGGRDGRRADVRRRPRPVRCCAGRCTRAASNGHGDGAHARRRRRRLGALA